MDFAGIVCGLRLSRLLAGEAARLQSVAREGSCREMLRDLSATLTVCRVTNSKMARVQAVHTATSPLWSQLRRPSPRLVTSTEQIGRAMIRVAREGYLRKVLEMEDINSL
ncbi:hypothetical protein [Bradyrhizobium centrosematis]|uniref:hypothetical protein n=1 Tax=Bradyrhizobium centrosematis TaxID=1300039 RepID=UPI00388FA1D4